jgi:prophage antirepressor-like protein
MMGIAKKDTSLEKTFKYLKMPVRVISFNNEPYWALIDVCGILGLSNARSVAARLDDDEVRKFDLRGLEGETWFVNEPGLYDVILRSDKPAAKKFRRWITHDVIPSIRKKGFYGRMSKWDAMDACKRHKITPDEYYQYVRKMPYKYLPASATKEQRYRNKITRLEKELATYRQIHDVYEYTLRDVAAKVEMTEYATWEAIKRLERQGHDFEYKEMLGKTRFTHTDKMKLFQLVNQERKGIAAKGFVRC